MSGVLLVVRVDDLESAVRCARAALKRKVVILELPDPSSLDAEAALDVIGPNQEEPLRFMARAVGEAVGLLVPLELRPRDDFDEGSLLAFLGAAGALTRPPPAHTSMAPARPSAAPPARRTVPPIPREDPAQRTSSPPASEVGTRTSFPPPDLVAPLEDASAGLAELFLALTSALARTTYYERGHPESERSVVRLLRAAFAPLRGRREIAFGRRTTQGVSRIVVQTGIGESAEIRRLLKVATEDHAIRLAEVFERRHVVVLTLREGLDERELEGTVELLAGPEVPEERMREALARLVLEHVSVLFDSELLGTARKLPWHVDICISRLTRDLRVIPMLQHLGHEAMRALREQIVADVVRPLRETEHVLLLLANVDLVTAAIADVPELAHWDARTAVVAALPLARCIRVTATLLRGTIDEEAREILLALAPRILPGETDEAAALARELAKRGIGGDVSEELAAEVQAERLAEDVVKDGEAALTGLGVEKLPTLARACRILARRDEREPLTIVLVWLERMARASGDVAAATLGDLLAPDVLLPLARDVLSAAHRDSAIRILRQAGDQGARALCAARAELGGTDARGRFRALAKQLDAPRALVEALATQLDSGMLEDLLRSLPDAADDEAGVAIAPLLGHHVPAVRRSAATALGWAWGDRALRSLTRALETDDDGVRIAIVAALRRLGVVDGDVVEELGRLLAGAFPAGAELRVAAAAALADVKGEQRADAIEILTRVVDPPKRGAIASLFAAKEDPLVVDAARDSLAKLRLGA